VAEIQLPSALMPEAVGETGDEGGGGDNSPEVGAREADTGGAAKTGAARGDTTAFESRKTQVWP